MMDLSFARVQIPLNHDPKFKRITTSTLGVVSPIRLDQPMVQTESISIKPFDEGIQQTDSVVSTSFNAKFKEEEKNVKKLQSLSTVIVRKSFALNVYPVKVLTSVKGYSANAIKERKMKDETCFQQAICLMLFHFFGEFTILKPVKQSSATNSLPKLYRLHFLDVEIKIEEFLSLIYKNKNTKFDGTETKKTIQRSSNKNALYATHNYLLDILRICGFFFESTYPKKSCKCMEQERVKKIFYGNHLLLTKSEMDIFGKEINDFFLGRVLQTGSETFSRNNRILETFLSTNVPLLYQKLVPFLDSFV
ncbi:hypothetical protein EIN_487630 [Entamoeba invadens IP1]|uniref:Uncharacterized protein n=1 Tax=Entamoeba invadens IP1 TaxID=370355 RepID=A0A0A1U4U2_ENTIV|nr:hypothetical protein EIN_487630 [Entamoeba invadens IP1]ELP89261.1 hypothetical protein EIN_487630 [Entamoeba invadens IP1]|eukprot:XP_004256032.1 hypothetical protein EIN_487630 [Entamoeba invadens IP1]